VSTDWIDVSVPLTSGMLTWPGDPPVRVTRALDQERGDPCTLSHLDLGAHTGTHMDAPLHYLRGGASIDTMPLDATVGPARVIAIADPVSVTAAELEMHALGRGERVLFKTRNSARRWVAEPFDETFVYISHGAALHLAERGVRTVGVDYLSVGGFHHDDETTHRALLGAGIWVIEGLDLSLVEPGDYEMICLPLRVAGADGAPARALLRPLAGANGKEPSP
jgi:arylformamidase